MDKADNNGYHKIPLRWRASNILSNPDEIIFRLVKYLFYFLIYYFYFKERTLFQIDNYIELDPHLYDVV